MTALSANTIANKDRSAARSFLVFAPSRVGPSNGGQGDPLPIVDLGSGWAGCSLAPTRPPWSTTPSRSLGRRRWSSHVTSHCYSTPRPDTIPSDAAPRQGKTTGRSSMRGGFLAARSVAAARN
ncbi:hypothetical protein J6590_017225 [Homalodisca vitripennis]|nr:hypothetical protein J6590_017225 [Homalodisca vitripennis]